MNEHFTIIVILGMKERKLKRSYRKIDCLPTDAVREVFPYQSLLYMDVFTKRNSIFTSHKLGITFYVAPLFMCSFFNCHMLPR